MFALLATVFHVADIFSDSGYTIYFLLFVPFNNNYVLYIIFIIVNFLLFGTCLLCTVCDYFGRWRGCLQCGQSIVCLPLFRGHTCVCVCPSCCMPE